MRLTNFIRKRIKKNVLEETFKERAAKINAEYHQLAYACRDKLLGKHRNDVLALPDGIANKDDVVRVNIDGQRVHIPFTEDYKDVVCPRGPLILKASSRLAKNILTCCEERELMAKERVQLGRDLMSLLNSVTTDKKLIEVWPEAKNYLVTDSAPVYALMVRPEDINKQIKKAKAA